MTDATLLLPLHLEAFSSDQTLLHDEIVKRVSAKGPIAPLTPADANSPASISGLVRTRRRVEGDAVEEYRELCAAELFDAVLSDGGALLDGDLAQG